MRCVNNDYPSFPHTATQEIKQKLFEGELDEHEVMRYVTFVPVDGLTVRVCSSEGRVIVSVFCPALGASDHFKYIKPTCVPDNTTEDGSCKCMEFFINGITGPPGEGPQKQHSRRRARRETNTTEVHITIEGMESENVFVMDIHDGDVPNDCVGKMIADNCIYPEGMDVNYIIYTLVHGMGEVKGMVTKSRNKASLSDLSMFGIR